MLIEEPIRNWHELFIPVIVAGLVPADQKQRGAAWIKCEQHTKRPSGMLNDKFLHIGMARTRYVSNVGAPERRPEFFQKINDGGNTLALFVREAVPPSYELRRGFDVPCHDWNIT